MKRSKVITAVIAIIAVVAAACVYGYVRSKPADEPEKPAVTEPENPTTPETPDDSNSGKPSDSKTDEPAVQPENPNPSGTESVTIYVPDEQGETLTPTGAASCAIATRSSSVSDWPSSWTIANRITIYLNVYEHRCAGRTVG